MTKLLIGALSAASYDDRRMLCRETWWTDIQRLGHSAFFLLGRHNGIISCQIGDMLVLDAPDDYVSLPQKTRAFCHWALSRNDWDYIYKCDDDTLVAPKRLHDLAQRLTGDYVGCEYHPQMKWHSGGAGYFLSRAAAAIIATQMFVANGPEDLLVGAFLNWAGMRATYMPETSVGTNGDIRYPMPGNAFIVGHGKWLTDEMWRDSYSKVNR